MLPSPTQLHCFPLSALFSLCYAFKYLASGTIIYSSKFTFTRCLYVSSCLLPNSIENREFWNVVQNSCNFRLCFFVSLTSSIQRCYSSNCSKWWFSFPRKHRKFNATSLSANIPHYTCIKHTPALNWNSRA